MLIALLIVFVGSALEGIVAQLRLRCCFLLRIITQLMMLSGTLL